MLRARPEAALGQQGPRPGWAGLGCRWLEMKATPGGKNTPACEERSPGLQHPCPARPTPLTGQVVLGASRNLLPPIVLVPASGPLSIAHQSPSTLHLGRGS